MSRLVVLLLLTLLPHPYAAPAALERPYFGWQLRAGIPGETRGLVVATVIPGGPADEAALAEGDQLLQVGGLLLETPGLASLGAVQEQLARHEPGRPLLLRYRRELTEHTTSITPRERRWALERLQSDQHPARELLLLDLTLSLVEEGELPEELQDTMLALVLDASGSLLLRRTCLELLGEHCDRVHLDQLRAAPPDPGSDLRVAWAEALLRAEDRLGLLRAGLADLERAVRWIRDRYVDPEDVQIADLVEAAITGMLDRLDVYSELQSPLETQRHRHNQYGGIGVSIESVAGRHHVLRVYDGPARGVLQPDDEILAVDDQPMVDRDRADLTAAIRGDPGTELRLTVRRPDTPEPVQLRIERGTIQRPIVTSCVLPGGIGYLRLHSFSVGADTRVGEAISGFGDRGVRALILDLRGNRGGAVYQVRRVAGIFLGPDQLVSFSIGREGSFERREAITGPSRVRWPGSMVTLIDERSASAAEMLAGALSCHERTTLVGASSFGKGIGQSTYALDSELGRRYLKLTTFHYYLPDGSSIDQCGITPDLEVASAAFPEAVASEIRRLRWAGAFRRYLTQYLHFRPEDPTPLAAATFFNGPRDPDTRFPGRREWYAGLDTTLTLELATEGLRLDLRRQAEHILQGPDSREPFTCDLEGDLQLQAAINLAASSGGIDLQGLAAYEHFSTASADQEPEPQPAATPH